MTALNYLIGQIVAADPTAGSGLINPSTLVALIAAAAAIGGAVLTYRSSQRANTVSDKKVDLEEHRDAIARLQAVIGEQDRLIERLRGQMDRMFGQVDQMQTQVSHEQGISTVLRRQVSNLEEQVRMLRRMLEERTPRRAAEDRIAGSQALLPDVTD